MRHSLENESLKLELDSHGSICSFFDKRNAREIVAAPGLWRIIYQEGNDLEKELLSQDIPLIGITLQGDTLRIVHESLVRVELTVRLHGNAASFDATMENKADIVVSEFQFPYFNLGTLAGSSLVWSCCGGELWRDIPEALARHHTQYMAQDDKAVQMSALYPGMAATNCFAIMGKGHGIYFGSHDGSFQNTLHNLRGSDDGVRAMLVKYPFLRKGSSARLEGFTIAPFAGTWHEAAKIYRAWADSWFTPPQPPRWICDFNGWQRLIMRHQYGQTFFTYAELPQMLSDGMAVGIDSILLFGWTLAGHDCKYPDYQADESQGGLKALRKEVAKIHHQGGKLMLYFNGQLIDKGTDYYEREGRRISIKDMSGQEHMETYSFSGAGTALRQFGNRVFVTACFSCREWFELLRSCVDIAIEIGADGVFFDQFGYQLWPCCDPSHGHPVPDMRGFETKARVVEELRGYVKSRKPDMAFGTEWLSDRLAPHVDFIHNVGGGYSQRWTGGDAFMEWFRYIFPETQFSDREIRDDKSDFKRRLNHALQMGLKSDVEIFRCRATIASAPKYGEYLAQANVLRHDLKDFLHNGQFLDDTAFICSHADIRAKAFTSGDRLLIMATHRGNETLKGELSVPGFKLEDSRGLGAFSVTSKNAALEIELPPDSLAALLFRKA